jgi:4-amino-4-deoxy-L-arabinose transferase-like glycosyltransferase
MLSESQLEETVVPARTSDPTAPKVSRFPLWLRRAIPLVGGFAALALALWGESIVESGNTTPSSLVLYLLAIALFAASALPMPQTAVDLPGEETATDLPQPEGRLRVWAIMVGGAAIAIVLCVLALFTLQKDLKSVTGTLLWLASMAALLATGIALRGLQGWPARWAAGIWPSSARGRWLVVAAIVVILVLAAAGRLLWLDQVPFGVNADEGDRAALSIQIVHGDTNPSIFDVGWYYIAMMYFWLLAQFMHIVGIGFAQVRAFSGLFGILSVGVVTWLGIRNFGLRVGLLAGALLSVLAVSLQFGRFTSESGPTATLWALSIAFFLEAARRGRSWAWIAAGITGGYALYFYPTGKLWVVVATGFCVYLLVRGPSGRRLSTLRGASLAALGAIIVMAPYVLNAYAVLGHPEILYLRAQETSIFNPEQRTHLYYYNPQQTPEQFLALQATHSMGIFNQFGDAGGTWPTDKPIFWGLLAVLTLIGIGWVSLRWRDPRFVMLALWFWTGFIGVFVTVDTPGVQRMATAVPVLALFPALVLDNLARRVEMLFKEGRVLSAEKAQWLTRRAGWVATAAIAVVIGFLMVDQWQFYFGQYAHVDKWMWPTAEGKAVAGQGTDTLVTTVGRESHMVNSGWIRLLAPETPRAGIPSPGSDLPLNIPADKNLAFMLFNDQLQYLPYLRDLYPVGATRVYTHPTEGKMFTMYRVAQQDWAALQGAMAHPPSGPPQQVQALGEAPPGWTTYPSPMRWTAGLFVPQYWNYSVRIGPGPAQLSIDGTLVLSAPDAGSVVSTTVSLARGDHDVEYDGTLAAPGQPAQLEWASVPAPDDNTPAPALDWQPVAASDLMSTQSAPVGLLGTATIEGRPSQQWIDRTLATCCVSGQIRADGHVYTATWTGTLTAPSTGVYSMTLFTVGKADLKLDGNTVILVDSTGETYSGGSVSLQQGPHSVELDYKVTEGQGGVEWSWTPPGGEKSLVPPSVLLPPKGAGVGPPVPFDQLGRQENQPVDSPLSIVK